MKTDTGTPLCRYMMCAILPCSYRHGREPTSSRSSLLRMLGQLRDPAETRLHLGLRRPATVSCVPSTAFSIRHFTWSAVSSAAMTCVGAERRPIDDRARPRPAPRPAAIASGEIRLDQRSPTAHGRGARRRDARRVAQHRDRKAVRRAASSARDWRARSRRQTERSASTRDRHGAQTRMCCSTSRRSAPASSPSTNGVTSGSMDAQLGIGRLHVIETLEQHATAPRNPRHDRAGRNLEHRGDFGVGKLFHVT